MSELAKHWAACAWIKAAHRRTAMNGEPRIYFIEAQLSGFIKIGTARDLKSRLSALQTGSAEPLRVLAHRPGNREEEQWIHGQLAAHRHHGEWFCPHEDVMRFVRFALRFPQAMPVEPVPRYWRKAQLAAELFMQRFNMSEDEAFDFARIGIDVGRLLDYRKRSEDPIVLADFLFAQTYAGMA